MIAAHPGPALHIALLGAIIVIALIVYAIVRFRRRRETAEAERLDGLDDLTPPSSPDRHQEQ